MSTLLDFLTEHPVDDISEEIIVSNRFKDSKGKVLKFKIKAMTGKEYSDYQKQSSYFDTSTRTNDINLNKYQELIVINNTVEPCFKDADAMKKLGCVTPEQFLYKTLLAGEISTLAENILNISGFNIDIEEVREEAKNS